VSGKLFQADCLILQLVLPLLQQALHQAEKSQQLESGVHIPFNKHLQARQYDFNHLMPGNRIDMGLTSIQKQCPPLHTSLPPALILGKKKVTALVSQPTVVEKPKHKTST